MSLTGRMVAVKGLRPGELSATAGATPPTSRGRSPSSRPATPTASTADGESRLRAGRGHRAPVVGAISMDMLIDVTGLGDVVPGDEVVIIGRQGDEGWQQIDAREMAAVDRRDPLGDRLPLGTRVERVFE